MNLGEIPEYPVILIGLHQLNKTYLNTEGTFCRSTFESTEWARSYYWMRISGFYRQPSQDEVDCVYGMSQDMPKWPNEGAVALKDDLIIVNYGG